MFVTTFLKKVLRLSFNLPLTSITICITINIVKGGGNVKGWVIPVLLMVTIVVMGMYQMDNVEKINKGDVKNVNS